MEPYNPTQANVLADTKPLAVLNKRWMAAIAAAKKHRKEEFDNVADEARQYFDGTTSKIWKEMASQAESAIDQGFLAGTTLLPQFKISVNRMFDAVSMFGPSLYHTNPTIAVTPRSPLSVSIDTYYADVPQAMELISMIPAMQQGIIGDQRIMDMAIQLQQQYEAAVNQVEGRSKINADHANIIENLANYYQKEGGKKSESRLAITEAIITGLGLMETVFEESPSGGPRLPKSRFLSNKQFLVDPDAMYWRDVTYIAICRTAPANQVEQKFGLPEGYLKGKHAANTALGGQNAMSKERNGDGKIRGVAHELVEYYDVYSKNGAGQRLKLGDTDRKLTGLDGLGDFVYLAICPTCDHPLNLPPGMMISDPVTAEATQEALEATAWPAPFWSDDNTDGGWPVSRLTFYENPGKTWPISMCKACLPEMRFVNWCMSFLADGVAAGSKTYIGMLKSAAESIREQIAKGSGPYVPIEIESIQGQSLKDMISFLQAPSFNLDIWKMLSEVNTEIDKRLGLTELMYGMAGRQMRSAAEAQYRQQNINIRPDDMANQVEDWLSVIATREIQMIRWAGEFQDVQPIVGELAAQVFVTQIQTQDVAALTREFRFRVEAGSARKPNKDTKIAQLNEIGQYLLPVAQQAMQIGVYKPWNAFVEDYAKAMDLDATRYMLTPQDHEMMMQYQMMMNQPQVPESKPAEK